MLKARSPLRAQAKSRTISPPPPSRQGLPLCRGSSVVSLCALRGCLLRRPAELGPIDPHAVQNDRELARNGDLGLAEPLRLVSLVPQDLSTDHCGTRVSSTPAASNRYIRSMASPHFEIRADQS